ncbi:MAG: ATP synthase F1 subunit epsilon [Gemmatimonadetes bacterium]|nr:ATP synthase F1 subunit epsilon [Gemmatimonadota bacterium]
MAAERLTVRVISPERTVFEGSALSVVAPAWDGMLGILRGHAPMVTLLGTGELRVRDATRESRFRVDGGVLQVRGDRVTVLSDSAEEIAVSD